MDCCTLDFPVFHYLPEFAQTHIHWLGDAIQPSHPLSSPSPSALNLSQHQVLFQRVNSSHQVAKGLGLQSSINPSNEYSDWFPLGLSSLISLLFKGLLRVFFSTIVQKHQFFGTQPSLWSSSHICTWPQESDIICKWYYSLNFMLYLLLAYISTID